MAARDSSSKPSGGESPAHRRLKRAALEWAQIHGYPIGGLEVRIPKSNYRADAAAYRPARKGGAEGQSPSIGETAVFECKQARSDFLHDAYPETETSERLGTCRTRMARLERLLGVHHPDLRRGDSLFPELETFNLETLQHQGYQRLRREIRILESRLLHKTKLAKVARYRCADFLYLVVDAGVADPHEVPSDWGILVFDPETESLNCIRPAPNRGAEAETRLQLLERLAISGTRLFNRQEAIDSESVLEARRKAVREIS